MSPPSDGSGNGTSRLEALADGIFAFAMTLLVLGIDLPSDVPSDSADQAIWSFLVGLQPQFLVYILAFFTLGAFWYGHLRQFRFIKQLDGRIVWTNLIGMMFTALIPFTTNLAGDYGEYQMGILPLEINILLMNLIFYHQWSYITSSPHLLSRELSPDKIALVRERHIVQIIVILAAIGISFFSPEWSILPFMLMPYLFATRRYKI